MKSSEHSDEDEVIAVKLALLGIALWSNKEWCASKGDTYSDNSDIYAIITLESVGTGGVFFFEKGPYRNFYGSRREAYEAALEALSKGVPRHDY